MLVLSRRPQEKVLFPTINAAVQVVSIKNGVVRLGIEAPPDVTIVRQEIASRAAPAPAGAFDAESHKKLLRQLRDRLHGAGVGLGAVQLLLDAGKSTDAGEVLARVRDEVQLLRLGLEGELDEAPPAPRPASKTRKALLVEDDRCQRELLAGFLRMAGMEVDTAGDGSDALDYLRSRPRPDVVLMDMGLPRCDGATAVRHIRQDPSYAGLRIYAVTGSTPEQLGLPQGPAGVDRWFQKPLDPSALLHDLRQELDGSPCCV
jgi:carbon storage regulator CsrA